MKNRIIWENLQSDFELPKPSLKQMGDLLLSKAQLLYKELGEQEVIRNEEYAKAAHMCAAISALAAIIFDEIFEQHPTVHSASPEGELNR